MAEIGKQNQLTVLKKSPQGLYLQGGWLGEVLLPNSLVPCDVKIGDTVDVFIYLDSEDRYIATTQPPKAQVGEAAYLRVKEVTDYGAFLDWGLPKDLLVPFSEQQIRMKQGESYVVYLYSDEKTRRIAASSKLNKYIKQQPKYFKRGQAVDLIIADKTDIGFAAIIDNRGWGVIFFDDAIQPLTIGKSIQGFIKQVRPDGKIDLCLQAPGYAKVPDLSERVLEELTKNNGFLALSDKSTPEDIKKKFGVSKNAYKMAIGALFKKRLIRIEKEGITLLTEENNG